MRNIWNGTPRSSLPTKLPRSKYRKCGSSPVLVNVLDHGRPCQVVWYGTGERPANRPLRGPSGESH